MDRKQLRAIAQAKELQAYNQATQDIEPPLTRVRIGERDPMTGKDEVIYPDGGKEIAGKRLFNSSVPVGRDVPTALRASFGRHVCTAARASGDSIVMLDAKNYKPEEIEETPTSSPKIDSQTYIIAYIDTSGSMDNEIEAIEAALDKLKKLLKKIYKTDKKLEKYYQVKKEGSERWLRWFSVDPREEETEPNKVIVLGFINESNPIYHQTPRDKDQEPTSAFVEDYNLFLTQYKERSFFQGKIYSVKYPAIPELETAFSAHVKAAIDGEENYASLEKKLKSCKCSYKLGIEAATKPEFYLSDIKKMI